ncbi:MAG: hypothetical protein C0595_11935 [Marinilabiliales bacterium]|nr:MAG: hypothetical protein C0595_11935 [Marinilabiliales bacterium]
MKTILISDIKGEQESILVYGMNFAKYSNDNVKVVHVVDPRKHHAVSSAYSDSQTFEVGEKLSPKAIINREIDRARTDLDKLLSSEASRLNYPLRVEVSVTDNSIEKQLEKEKQNEDDLLFLTSAKPDGTVIDDLEEFFQLTNSFKNYSLLIPPGVEFKKPEKALVLYDFNIKEDQNIFSLLLFLSKYELSLDVVDVCEKKDFIELQVKSELWKQTAINQFRSRDIWFSTNILEGDNYLQTIVDFTKRNHFDMLIISRQNPNIINKNVFSTSGVKQLINDLNIPILLY